MESTNKFYSQTEYDEKGKAVAEYDATGENKTELEYVDGTDVVCNKKLANGSKFAYGYDEEDNVTSISHSTEDGEENATHTRYSCGLVTELVSGNNTVKYKYDEKRRVSSIDLNGTENYIKTDYTEDNLNGKEVDKITTTFSRANGVNESFTSYKDKTGKLLKTEEGQTAVTYEYDTADKYTAEELQNRSLTNKVKKITVINGNSSRTAEEYNYDKLGREETHKFNGNETGTVYDNYGNVVNKTYKFSGSSSNDIEYSYVYGADGLKELKSLSVGSYGEEYKKDYIGRTKEIISSLGANNYSKRLGYYKCGDHATNRINTLYFGKNGVTDRKLTYTYDGMGNIISVNENGKQIVKYEYDKLSRLVKEINVDNGKEVCYTYDNNGNILTKSTNGTVKDYKYQIGTDRLVSFGEERFEYDNVGNPILYRGKSCEWAKGRQLQSVNDGTNVITFTYDYSGLRAEKTVNSRVVRYCYENGRLLRQTSGNEIIDFIYGAEGVIGFKLNNASYLYRKNLLGDVIEIIDEAGNTVGKYAYSAFGECQVICDLWGIAAKNPIRYRSYYYDEELSLYYLKSRYYDPEIGRFITIDDTSFIAPDTINGLNLYAYCNNNPIINIDPNGNSFWDWVNTIIGFLNPLSTITAIGSILVAAISGRWSDVVDDWNNGRLNPFNQDINVAHNPKVLSFYKGSTIINVGNGYSAFTIAGTVWAQNGIGLDTLRHEYGHTVQEKILGPLYLTRIAIPSFITFWVMDLFSIADPGQIIYLSMPWERTAEWLGGTAPKAYKKNALTWGVVEHVLGPITIPFYFWLGF